MMEGAEHHPDPLREATDRSKERAARIGSIASAATQVAVQLKAQHEQHNAARDEQTARELGRQQRAEQQAARTRWAPAHDREWLRQADVVDSARVWGAAMPYAASDTAAASAMRKCEDHLRDLHPYAMARYDRLRADGVNPGDAMAETAPLFAREPNPRTGDPAPERAALPAQAGHTSTQNAVAPADDASPMDAERRANDQRAFRRSSSPVALAAESFPHSISETVQATVNTRSKPNQGRSLRTYAPPRNPRRGLHH